MFRNLIISIILIFFGLFLKNTKNELFYSLKKSWWCWFGVGLIMLILEIIFFSCVFLYFHRSN